MIADLIVTCPEMATRHVSHGLSRTDLLHASWRLVERDTQKLLASGPIDFPPTLVHGRGLNWMVEPCTAKTPDPLYPIQVVSKLPEEPCRVVIFDSDTGQFDPHMAIHGIWAETLIVLPDKGIGTGKVWYPDCKAYRTAKGVWTVETVQAKGEITFP